MLSWVNAETPRERAYLAACAARVNVVYYQRMIGRLETVDRWFRVGSTLLASAGVAAALKFAGPNTAIVAGTVSAILSAVTLVWGFADKARSASAILPRYVAHFHALQKLYLHLDEAKLEVELEALAQTEMAEADKVKAPDEKALQKAYEYVSRELNCTPALPTIP